MSIDERQIISCSVCVYIETIFIYTLLFNGQSSKIILGRIGPSCCVAAEHLA